jgi:HAMP domain-containing protein
VAAVNAPTAVPADDAAATRRWVLVLIGVALVGRVIVAATVGLGIDESYTVATARSFALGTYDHPPLAW